MDDGAVYRDQIRSAIANLDIETIDLIGRCHVADGETCDEAARRTASESVKQITELELLLDDFSKITSDCKKVIKKAVDVAKKRLCVLSKHGEISGSRLRELTQIATGDEEDEEEDT